MEATFSPSTKTYWVINSSIVFVSSIVGIPLLIIWLPLASIFTSRYLSSLSCVLTERSLIVKKGIWNRIEKTVPLDKITDLGLAQGPVMRALGIEQISVETAGSSAAGALVSLPGIEGEREFRDAVFRQKEDLAAAKQSESHTPPASTPAPDGTLEVLTEIKNTLWRIEAQLSKS
jgi:putative membrane protein